MYIVQNNKKVHVKTENGEIVEGFKWSSSHTWLVIGGIVLAIIFIVLLILMLTKKDY